MVNFLSPEVRVTEVRAGPVTVPAISIGTGAFEGVALKGPINEPILVFGIDDAFEVFGGFITAAYMMNAVQHFFENGGESCYINRVAHYTDITDAATLTAIAADTMLQTLDSSPTVGSLTSSVASFPAVLPAGTVFDGEVDAGAEAGFTINATVANVTGVGGTFAAGAGGDTLVININSVPGDQTIDLSATGATLADYINDINTALLGGHAEASGGQIRIVTDQKGSGAGGNIVSFGGAAEAKTGLSTGALTNAGPNNVVDDRAVTAAEFASLMDGGFPGSTSTVIGTDQVQWDSVAVGAAASVQFTLPATIAALIPGFDLLLHSGLAAGSPVDTLLVSASSEGIFGNLLRTTTTKIDTIVAEVAVTASGSTSSIILSSVLRVFVGDTISITQGIDVQRAVITSIDPVLKSVVLELAITVPGGGYAGTEDVVVETFTLQAIDENGVITNAFRNLRMSSLAGSRYVENVINDTSRTPVVVADQGLVATGDNRPADVVSSLLGQTTAGSDGGTVVDTDFIGSATSNLGLNAFDDFDDFLMISVPGVTTVLTQKGLETYGLGRQDVYALLDLPQGLTPTEARTYVTTTANFASSFEGIYYPWLRAVDPNTSGPASFPTSGFVMGIFARTFRIRNFGKAPAGTQDGLVRGVVGVDTVVKKPSYDILYPASINAIQPITGSGITVMGSRTLDPLGDFLQVNRRIVFLVVKAVFREGTQFVLFEVNNRATRARVTRFMTLFLRGLRQDGVLDGETDAEAFFVQCNEGNNTATVRRQGKLVCRVGLNVGDTIEFVDITLEQDTRALDAEIATEVG